jgi:hypothetical protein
MQIRHLPFPSHKKVVDHTLSEDLFIEQWLVPKGTLVKLSYPGILVLPKECADKRGFVIPRRIFQW